MPFSSKIISSFCIIMSLLLCSAMRIAADTRPAASHEKDRITRLAIFLLASGPGDDGYPGADLFDLLTVELTHKPGIELVERAMVDKILDEYSLTLEQLVDPRKALRIGKMSGADVTIMGRPVRLSEKKALWVKVIDNATGIIKGVDCFLLEGRSAKTLESLTGFAWAASIADITRSPIKIIAVGGFEDQSINDLQMGRGDEIRRFLEKKYTAAPGVLVVERSQMRPLLLESGLNRMGLTTGGDDSNSARSAFIVLSGDYHVIRKSETIYMVNLRIDLLGKGNKRLQVQSSAWHDMLEKIGKTIDDTFASMDGPQVVQ